MSELEVLFHKDNISVVRLKPNQWQTLRDLKIRSIVQDPLAFADPIPELDKYKNRSEEEWRSILSGKMSGGRPGESIVLFAKDGQDDVGLITAIIPQQEGNYQMATVQHTFVDENHRRKGIGEELLRTLIEQLKQRSNIGEVELDVVVTQQAAIDLYKRLGFRSVGFTKEKAKRGEKEYDRYDMKLALKPLPPKLNIG